MMRFTSDSEKIVCPCEQGLIVALAVILGVERKLTKIKKLRLSLVLVCDIKICYKVQPTFFRVKKNVDKDHHHIMR